jgi:hypothetical protein
MYKNSLFNHAEIILYFTYDYPWHLEILHHTAWMRTKMDSEWDPNSGRMFFSQNTQTYGFLTWELLQKMLGRVMK